MKNSIFLFLFSFALIAFVSVSNGFALQNVQIHKPIITVAGTDDSVDEESILEEQQKQCFLAPQLCVL